MKIPIIPIISMENSHQFSKSSKVITGVFIGVRGGRGGGQSLGCQFIEVLGSLRKRRF